MDKESVAKDDLVGSGKLDIGNLIKDGQNDNIIGGLIYKQEDCGNVFFSITQIPEQTVVFIQMLRAELYEDTDWFSKIDPYAVISHNELDVHKTPVLDNKGQNPEWKL